MKAAARPIDYITDEELVDEALDRGLVLGVETRDLVELYWAAKNDDPVLCHNVIKRLARVHLGKLL